MSPQRSEAGSDTFQFIGWDVPNTTQIPDIFFDFIAPTLGEAELRVLVYILRRTYSFKKDHDAISLSQLVDGITTREGKVLDRGTGMTKKLVIKGCAGLVTRGYVIKDTRRSEQGDSDSNVYRLRFRGDDLPAPRRRGVVDDVHHRSGASTPRVVDDVHTQVIPTPLGFAIIPGTFSVSYRFGRTAEIMTEVGEIGITVKQKTVRGCLRIHAMRQAGAA
jgi:hypothetical protein